MNNLNKLNVKELSKSAAKNTFGGCDNMSIFQRIGCAVAKVSDFIERAHNKHGGNSSPTYGAY